jgi:hypothetical protein
MSASLSVNLCAIKLTNTLILLLEVEIIPEAERMFLDFWKEIDPDISEVEDG